MPEATAINWRADERICWTVDRISASKRPQRVEHAVLRWIGDLACRLTIDEEDHAVGISGGNRVVARFGPLSSTNTRVTGSRVLIAAHHAARSESSRSATKRSFFERNDEAAQGARHGSNADVDVLFLHPDRALIGLRRIQTGGRLRVQARRVIWSDGPIRGDRPGN